MRLTKGPRKSAEDVFLIGEELGDDDAEPVVSFGADPEGSSADGLEHGEASGPAPRGRKASTGRGGAVRWTGVAALVFALGVFAAIVFRAGGDEPQEPSPTAGQPTAAELQEQRVRERRNAALQERSRERRQERLRKQRARERREAAKRRERRRARRAAAAQDVPDATTAASTPAAPATPPASAAPPSPTNTAPSPTQAPQPSGTESTGSDGGGGAPVCDFTFEC